MPRCCAVPSCKSGSRVDDGIKYCFFSVGKNEKRQKEWQKAIGIDDLTEKNVVCEKHFHPSKIITKRVLRGPDGTVYSEIPYKITRLEEGAIPVLELRNDNIVPDQLLDHNYTNKKEARQNLCKVTPQKSSRTVHEQNVIPEISTCDIILVENRVTANHQNTKSEGKTEVQNDENLCLETENCTNQNDEQNVILEISDCDNNILVENHVTVNHQNTKSEGNTEVRNDESLCSETENCTNQNQTISFDDLRSNLSSIKTPMGWIKNETKTDIKDSVIYFTHTTVRSCENTLKLVSVKELIVQSDLQFAVNVMGKPINLKAIGIDTEKITDIGTLEQILALLDIHNVCKGFATDLNIDSSVTTRDCADIWRHNKCPLLLPSWSMCTNCRNVAKMVNQKRQKLVEKDERLRAFKSKRIRWRRNL